MSHRKGLAGKSAIVYYRLEKVALFHSGENKSNRAAVNKALDDGYRTADIYKDGFKKVGCAEMGDVLAANI